MTDLLPIRFAKGSLSFKYIASSIVALFPSPVSNENLDVDNRNWNPNIPSQLSSQTPKTEISLNVIKIDDLSYYVVDIRIGGIEIRADLESVIITACNADENSSECLNYSLDIYYLESDIGTEEPFFL